MSLRLKFLLILLAIFIPIVAVELYTFTRLHQQATSAVVEGELRTVDAVGALVDSMFEDALANAQSIASDPAVRQLDLPGAKNELAHHQATHPHYENIFIVDANGNQLTGVTRRYDPPPLSIGDRDYFQRMLATDQPILSNVLVGRVSQRPIVVAVAPIHDASGRIIGATVISINLERLAERLEAVPLADGRAIGLADPTGRLALHSTVSSVSWEQRDLSTWSPVSRAQRGEQVRSERVRSPISGDERMGAFVPTPRFGWVVFLTVPRDVAMAPIEETVRSRWLVLGGVSAFSIGLAIVASRAITRPLGALADAARSVQRGELRRRLRIHTGDELETVGSAFNDMAAQLELSAKVRAEVDRQREEFISIVTHDLRSPITAIVGYSQLLCRGRVTGSVSVDQHRMLDLIYANAQRLNLMVSDLLDATRIEAHRLSVERQPVALNDHVCETVEEVRPVLAPHPVTIEPATCDAVVDADPLRLAQVWTNLLTNAAKYSAPESPIEVIVESDHQEARVSVVDHGRGMPPEVLAHLFTPLYRAPQLPGSTREGIGLGLFIARGLVEAHGGTINVTSEVGRGSTFTVSLPLHDPCPKRQDTRAA